MSSAVFFHNFNEVNLKLWTIACLATVSLGTYSVLSSQPDTAKILGSLLAEGTQAESIGLYRQARQDYDMALLQARARGDKKVLISALINSARIDNEFEEDKLAISLAREALDLSSKLYGQDHEQTAEATAALADMLGDNEQSLSLYKKALAIFREKFGNDDAHVARILMEMSYCYDATNATGSAISAVKAAIKTYESMQNTNNADYAKALVQYATLMDLETKEKDALFKKALSIQETVFGKNHPALTSTLSLMAANETEFEKKEALLRRAMQIDETAFGPSGVQVARDLAALADANQSAGKRKEARDLRNRAALICREKTNALDSMSQDFLESYSKLLHDLKFDREAARIDSFLCQKQLSAPGAKAPAAKAIMEENDSENDPEYWERTELVPIDGIQKLATPDFDHIQLWYEKGELKLEAFRAGEIVWKEQFGQCPTGILNARVDKDTLIVSWRDGDGPVWHNDVYKLGDRQISLSSSSISDAYAQQIEQQLDDVLAGDTDAINDGAIESVPATYINNNFVADAIRKGEHKALKLYGEGDTEAAAERLGMIFDFSAKAINTQRSEINQTLSRSEAWLDAWKFQELPITDYITALNDYGFFLQQSGCIKDSANVLSLVVKVAPGRALGHLNLADSYWKLGKRAEAKSSYQLYLALIRNTNEKQSIPSRVFQRINHATVSKSLTKTQTLRS